MAEVIPFQGLRYDESKAGPLADLICPPYDIIPSDLRDALYARSPHNFVRIEHGRPEPDGGAAANKYSRAKAALDAWTAQGVLRYDPAPSFYLYDHHFEAGGRRLRRRGFLGALRLYPVDRGVVLPHEQTILKDRTDRLDLQRTTRLNASPIFGMYEDRAATVARLIAEWIDGGAARRVAEAEAGIERHVVWAIDDHALTARLATALAEARIYLADGHHRYEVALEHLKEETEAGRARDPNDPANFILAYLCALDDPGLLILPTHRIVHGARAALDAAVARSFERSPIDRGGLADTQPGIVLVRDGALARLEPRPDVDLSRLSEAWRSLPVAQAEALLIEPARSAGATVTYEHDTARAIDAARDGASAILVRTVDAATLKQVSDSRERLPAKTTYFYPKVPAGLVTRSLDA